jgi:DNA-binding CsgD family transcriptional regulator
MANQSAGTAGLTPAERALLRSRRRAAWLGVVALALCVLLLAALAALTALGRVPLAALIIAALLGALWIWRLAPALAQVRRIGRDLREGVQGSAEGPATIESTSTPGIFSLPRHRLHIGGRSFAMERDDALQVLPGAYYRAAFAAHSGELLALRPGRGKANDGWADELLPPVGEPSLALSGQERELLAQIAAGRSNKEIAAEMALSVNTVKMYSSQLYRKLGVRRRTEAVARARRDGLL